MAVPIANAGTSPAAQAFSVLPTAQALSFSGTPGTGGTSITHYKSVVLDKPDGSAAALSSTTTNNPNLTPIDTQGTATVFVRVADDRFNDALGPDPWLHADNANYVSEANPALAPTSAFVHVSIKTEHLDIEIPSTWQRDTKPQYVGFVEAVEALDVAVGAGVAPRSIWIQAHAGDGDADGSMVRPFNPTSAFDGGFDGPWDQAVTALGLLDLSVEPESGVTINVLGGGYTEDVAIAASTPWAINCIGDVTLTGTFDYVADSSPLAIPSLSIGPVAEGGSFQLVGVCGLGNPTANYWKLGLNNVTLASVAASGVCLAGVHVYAKHLYVSGTFNVPNLNFVSLDECNFTDLITARTMGRTRQTKLRSITISVAPANEADGFYGCDWTGATPVFTGPSGSAKFDGATARRFVDEGGTYAGGAGKPDWLGVSYYDIVTTTLTGLGAGDPLTLNSEGGIYLNANGGSLVGIAAEDASLGTVDGDVLLSAAGVGKTTTLTTADGNVVIDANGVGRNVVVTADDKILMDATGEISIAAGSGGGSGSLSLGASGAGRYVYIIASDGNVDVYAGGNGSLTLESTLNSVQVNAGANIGITSVGAASISTTGAAANVSLSAAGANSNASVSTTNGNVQIQAAGAGKYALVEAADGRVEINAIGTAHNVAITTTDGTIALSALGSGRTIALTAERVLINGVDAASLSRTLKAYAPNQATTGMTKELLASYTVPDDFFVTGGARLHIEVLMSSAANANSKTFDLELDGATLRTYTNTGPLAVTKFVADIFSLGSASQYTRASYQIGTATPVWDDVVTTKDFAAGSKQIQVYGTSPTALGEVTAVLLSVDYFPAVA